MQNTTENETQSSNNVTESQIDYESLGIVPVITGEKLREAVNKAKDERTPLIEGFCYEYGVIQVFADDGAGKSTAVLNAMLEASAGASVFKFLPCPKPLNIIWNCCERPLDEPLERIKAMTGTISPNYDNLVIDKEIQTMDLTTKEGLAKFIIRTAEVAASLPSGKADIIVLDPIYAITGGDLSDPRDVHIINHLIRHVQSVFGCAVIYTHHTNRGGRHEGKRTEGDMYGNRFLSANLTGLFHLKKTDDGIDLNCVKNTYGNLLSHIPLVFDEITQTLTISSESNDFNKRDKILMFLRKKHSQGLPFQLREIANSLKVSDAYIRKTIAPMIKTGHISNKSLKGIKASYFVEKTI